MRRTDARRRWFLACLTLTAAAQAAGMDAAQAPTAVPADTLQAAGQTVRIHPRGHASLVLQWGELTIAVDPVGGRARYADLPRPQLILVTHHHGDHLDPDTVRDLAGEHTVVVASRRVAESLPSLDPVALAPGEQTRAHGVTVLATAAYNTTAERRRFHPRGRDNGYLVTLGGARILISGDTEDVPELAELAPLDAAFLCMNLPWTMSVEQAVRAARRLRASVLYPYHYRNRDGSFADLDSLAAALAGDGIAVRRLAWY